MSEQHQHPFHSPVWDSNDAARLRNFLTLRTGKRLILRLRLERPEFPRTGSSPEAVALRAMEIAGYEQCIANIFDYLHSQPVADTVTTAYPNLDDDDAWPRELQTISRVDELKKEEADDGPTS